MASGKYTRLDGKKPSNCLTTIVVLFVGVCMIGAWMMMSSSMEGESRSNNVPEKENILIKGFKNRDQRTEVEKTSQKAETDDNDDGKNELEETGDIGADKKDTDERVEPEKDESISVSNNSKEAPEEKKNELDESSETKLDGTENEVGSGTQETGSEFKDEDQLDLEREKTLKITEGSSSTEGESTAQEGESLTTEENAGEKSSVQGNTESRKMGATGLLSGDLIQDGSWSTQSAESEKEKKSLKSSKKYNWKLCKVTAGADYIPCLDDIQTIRKLPSTAHYQHRERHCPEEAPTCLVPLPEGYKLPVKWSRSREKIWFSNVPHTRLAEYKGHQNWVKVSGEYLTFPGGGTQFKNGALHYIDLIQQTVPEITWGKRSHVILDVGCGVASFGGYLFDRGVLAMSFAPKDEHEAQVQFALERGIPAISAVMGTKRLPYPSMVFDVVHCARCRVPWHAEGGKLLLELNRVLRPGGYFVWSATPVYQNLTEDVAIWKAMSKLTKSMCWKLVKIGEDKLNQVAAAIYRKPTSNDCYENRPSNDPPICEESDDPNAAWNVELQACMHKVPTEASVRGSQWPQNWPKRVEQPPYWLKSSDVGVYGKSAPKDFTNDFDRWQHIVTKSYMDGVGIDWSRVRNVMDMRALYGGFAAALKNLNVWVMNVVPIDSPDTLPVIYERGLFGIYHDWCESFSTYPRTYDLLHADHLFSAVKKRCSLVAVIAEVDRILRPGGKLLVRDKSDTVSEVESMARSLHWEIKMTYSEGKEGLLCVHKTKWRPGVEQEILSAIA